MSGTQYEVAFSRLGRSGTGVPSPFKVWATGPEHLAQGIHRQARSRLASKEVEVQVDLERGTGQVLVGGFRLVGEFTVTEIRPETTDQELPTRPDGVPLRIAIDADCPACGKPERSFDPATGVFGCSSLGGDPCGYESKERNA